MGDAGRGDEVEHAFEEAVAGPEDRGEDRLLALQDGRLHLGQRRLDGRGGERQVAGHLIGEEQRDLAQELAEMRGRRILVAHQREFVLHEGVIDDGDAFHGGFPPLVRPWLVPVLAPERRRRQRNGALPPVYPPLNPPFLCAYPCQVMKRAFLLVMDSVGIGGAEDAGPSAMPAPTRSATSPQPARGARRIATACAPGR